jgi:hypothetical protein
MSCDLWYVIVERKVSLNMAGKKKEDITHEGRFEMRIPLDSDSLNRLRKISEVTGLSDHELLRKWILQEECNLHALQHYFEGIQLKLQHDSSPQENRVPQQIQEPLQKTLQTHGGSEESQESNYRQILLQRMQEMRSQGMTYSKIAAQFNEEGVATVSGAGKWYPSSISQFLATSE